MSTTRTAPKTPAGWSVELQGLSESVVFTNGSRTLIWCDGQWLRQVRTQDGRTLVAPAPGVRAATSMKDARRAGCEFLHEVESA